jgi:hypothetical protein
MKGEVCKVISVSSNKSNLFPIRVKSNTMNYAVFAESQLRLGEESK